MKANSLGKKVVTGNSAEKAGGLAMGNNSAILQA